MLPISEGDCIMITERLQQLIDEAAALPPEERDRVAAAMQIVQRQPSVTSDTAP
jgi:hypothetical protein